MKTLIQTDFNSTEIRLASTMALDTDYYVDDYVHLGVRGGVWRIVKVEVGQGIDYQDLLTLEWIGGCDDPGRLVKFSSGQARKITEMEVIAHCAK